jgi:hypothetical protein
LAKSGDYTSVRFFFAFLGSMFYKKAMSRKKLRLAVVPVATNVGVACGF